MPLPVSPSPLSLRLLTRANGDSSPVSMRTTHDPSRPRRSLPTDDDTSSSDPGLEPLSVRIHRTARSPSSARSAAPKAGPRPYRPLPQAVSIHRSPRSTQPRCSRRFSIRPLPTPRAAHTVPSSRGRHRR